MRLIDYFDAAAARHPNRIFVRDGARTVSYAEAQRASRRIANRLTGAGVGKGDKVAVYAQNGLETCLMALGVLRAGCVWATFDITAKVDAVAAALAELDVAALFYGQEYRGAVADLKARAPGLRLCVGLDGEGGDDLESWLGDASDDFADIAYDMEDLTTLFSSGGTTGAPKGVMASHRCWEAGLKCTMTHTPHPHPVELLFMPVTHVGGGSLLLYGMARGFTFIVLRRFDPDVVMQTIQDEGVTHMMVPPTALGIVLSHPKLADYDFSSLRGLLYGSGPTPASMVEKAYAAFGPVLITGFGQTETTTAVTVLNQDDHRAIFESGELDRLNSCGRVMPQFELEMMDEEGNILPTGAVGEVVVRGESIMTGYYKAPEETEAAARFGWHHTGDIGRKDEDGFVYILDRKKDMIISRGYKIYPAEVERVFYAHPAVRECAVVGAPDDLLGEVPKAFVALKAGQEVSPAELLAYCRREAGAQRSPASVEIRADLPKSRIGKILRREIRDACWAGRDKKV